MESIQLWNNLGKILTIGLTQMEPIQRFNKNLTILSSAPTARILIHPT